LFFDLARPKVTAFGAVTNRLYRAKKKQGEPAKMHLGYWLQFWWMFPIALTICITV